MATKKVKRICGGTMTVAEQKAKIEMCLSLHKEGNSVNEIAEKLNIDVTTAYKWLHKNNVTFKSRYKKYDTETIDKIAELYQTHTKDEVAEIMGMKFKDVMYVINHYSITKGEML